MVIFVFKIVNLACKNGGRDGLASGEPLRRRWRMAGNNGVLRKRLVLYRKPRPIDGTNPPRFQRRRACPRPALPGLRVYMFKSICPRQLVSFGVRREALGERPIKLCCWRAAEPAAPTVGAGNSGDTPLGRAAGCAAPTGSHLFRRFPPSLLFPLHSLLFFFTLLFRSGPMTVLAQRKNS